MKLNKIAAGLCASIALAIVAGCSNPNNVDAANRSVDNAANSARGTLKDAAKDATAAVVVTPLVKNAIAADSMLKDSRNTINVDSMDNMVHLRGKVLNNDMKKRAGEVAQKVLTENHSTDQLVNELMVKQH